MPNGLVVICNPEDVNLADVKAVCAEHDASVVANPHCPRGQVFLCQLDR